MSKTEWEEYATGLIKAEIAKKNISLIELSKRLELIGVYTTPMNISNKIKRGSFSVTFFLQVLTTLECQNLSLLPPHQYKLRNR